MEKSESVFIYIPDYAEVEYYANLAWNATNILKKEWEFPIEVLFNLWEFINEYWLGKECLHPVLLLNNLKWYVDDIIINMKIDRKEFNVADYNPNRRKYSIPKSSLMRIWMITTWVRDVIGKINYIDTGPTLFVWKNKNNLHQIAIHK